MKQRKHLTDQHLSFLFLALLVLRGWLMYWHHSIFLITNPILVKAWHQKGRTLMVVQNHLWTKELSCESNISMPGSFSTQWHLCLDSFCWLAGFIPWAPQHLQENFLPRLIWACTDIGNLQCDPMGYVPGCFLIHFAFILFKYYQCRRIWPS